MSHDRHDPIGWMATNPVAANLLMFAIIVAGLLGLSEIRREINPDFSLGAVTVRVSYPGASPQEVEEGIILAVEKELEGMAGIERVSSTAAEGSGVVSAELTDDADPSKLLQDIRTAVSRISSFPDDIEPPRVELREHSVYVISIGVAADLPAPGLFAIGERVRRQLLEFAGVSTVEIRGGLTPQISLEIDRAQLRALDLSLSEVAAAVRGAARDVPAGALETRDGELLLRTLGRREHADEFGDIPIKTLSDGSTIRLGDIASLVDGFDDTTQRFEFNGQTGIRLDVYQTERQSPVELATRVRELVTQLQHDMPPTVRVTVQNDRSERYAERRDILLKNGALGLTLVVLTLGAFLNLRLAFWVSVSIPVVFIGTFAFLPALDVALNMVSLFAFILTLGIVVDDAIIVGENIFAKTQQGIPMHDAVREGTREMVVPVLFAVGTNVIAFVPLMAVPGTTGQYMRALPVVAAVVFCVSLIEALLILPAHLNHMRNGRLGRWGHAYAPLRRITRFHAGLGHGFDRLRDGPFLHLIQRAVDARYLTTVLFCGLLALVVAWYQSGRIDLNWSTEIPGNRVDAELEMPIEASFNETLAVVQHIEAAGLRTLDKLGGRQYLQSWFTRTGYGGATNGDVNMLLVGDAQRPFTQAEFTRLWREEIGELPQIRSLFFEFMIGPGGNKDLKINLIHTSTDTLEAAARMLAAEMDLLQGVVDIGDGIADGKRQIAFTLTAEGRAAGLDEHALGRQIRDAFFGAEVQRILRDGREIKVMVRLPRTQRQSVLDLRDFPLRLPAGGEIPLARAAVFQPGRAYGTITRENGQRILTVSASLDKTLANTRRIRATLGDRILPDLQAQFPGLHWEFSGSRRDRNMALTVIFQGLGWVILLTFALMAALFRSYTQGLIVMATIPFSVAAAIAGHVAMGFDLSANSIFGMIALCGLVVNGALVLTVRLNEIASGDRPTAIIEATRSRFRPIVLTSLTTTVGLIPMLFETSPQALFLVPMAIALSFGTVASTLVVLLLIPCLHAVHDDITRWWRRESPD